MSSSLLKQFYQSSHLSGGNAPYVEELYESWLAEPASVATEWQRYFSSLLDGQAGDTAHGPIIERFRQLAALGLPAAAAGDSGLHHKQAGVMRLINAYRSRGHLKANLNPLGDRNRPEVPDLDMHFHDLTEADLDQAFDTGYLGDDTEMKLRDVIELCERSYCGSIGYEFMHITDIEQRRWLESRIEKTGGRYGFSKDRKIRILNQLTAAEGLEKYLHTKYVGQKRFSLEGGDSLIPLLDTLVQYAGTLGTKEIVLGMAHRGRLNVLVNILGKQPADLFAEFEGKSTNARGLSMGDVKYHMGYSSDMKTEGGLVHLALAFNPSHLEIVDPVVAGSARARSTRRQDTARDEVMPVLIHGDAALAGQGVVMELFNMSQARGFAVGGTVHIVVNNQIGFTTSNPIDARSTLYCTEVAKLVQAPIFHVNGDDPEAVCWITEVAANFRRRFKKDVMIDMVCYRRHGHNEADEPSATQPMMYQTIRALKTAREQYAISLSEQSLLSAGGARELVTRYRDALDAGESISNTRTELTPNEFTVDWSPYVGTKWTDAVDTGIDVKQAKALSDQLTTLPEDLKLHARVQRIIDDRRRMATGDLPMDWGFAETLAYANLIKRGYNLRLVGQDSGRGTFFHRHAVLHNQDRKQAFLPLAQLAGEKQHITVIDSLLSEEAVLGFEYGYATADPETLVIWEGQFGDFVNGAQVVIDQFITSGEAKWGRLCGLVMFLPHGFEGQGPEHSSARLERFLQLCSHNNIQICVPSTPAQMFHMLQRQMLRPYRKPLIVMTPKSLLRNKASTSPLEELQSGRFELVIDDPQIESADRIRRIVLCSGKVYYDLLEAREQQSESGPALVRVEQLYPFPLERLLEVLSRYPAATEIIWCQEEPQNQGAWYQIRHHLQALLGENQTLHYAGRPTSPSPAVGYYDIHVQEQSALVRQALTPGAAMPEGTAHENG